jgi:mannose-6-phosphate isomerase-like protein (cupin superfamily)
MAVIRSLSMRTVITTAVVVLAFGAGWLAKTSAQQKAPAPLITYFSHDKVDASFAQALGSTGSRDLFDRKDRQGHTWAIHSNSRGKSDEGKLHSHEDWTGVVVIMSGAATFITPGTASTVRGPRDTSEGGSLIGAGESHRVGKGDVVIIPPNAPHMYKNIEEPFRYLVIQTP